VTTGSPRLDLMPPNRGRDKRTRRSNLSQTEPIMEASLTPSLRKKETMNAEEKRLKMTKQVIAEFARNDNDDFFEKLQAKTTPEEQILNKEDDLLTRKMKMHLLESQGKLFYSIAEDFARCGEEEKAEMRAEEDEAPIVDDQFDRYFLKGHKKAITCLEWMPDN